MQLKNVGEICILDYSEVYSKVLSEIREHAGKLSTDDRRYISSVIAKMIDDHFTYRMHWTKRRNEFPNEHYIDEFGKLVDNHPDVHEFIEEIREWISDLLRGVIKFPTWHVVYMRQRIALTSIELELGEDFRIIDWMERHVDEYIPKRSTKSW